LFSANYTTALKMSTNVIVINASMAHLLLIVYQRLNHQWLSSDFWITCVFNHIRCFLTLSEAHQFECPSLFWNAYIVVFSNKLQHHLVLPTTGCSPLKCISTYTLDWPMQGRWTYQRQRRCLSSLISSKCCSSMRVRSCSLLGWPGRWSSARPRPRWLAQWCFWCNLSLGCWWRRWRFVQLVPWSWRGIYTTIRFYGIAIMIVWL